MDLSQMPGDTVTKPIKLQAFLDQPEVTCSTMRTLGSGSSQMQADGTLPNGDPTDFIVQAPQELWAAVARVNRVPGRTRTNVLWGSIGVNACHQALAGGS